MNRDIRLAVGFWDHPKTILLERRLGLSAVKSLQILWMWAAQNRPDGVLRGLTEEGVEVAARWYEPNEKNDALNGVGTKIYDRTTTVGTKTYDVHSTFLRTLCELGWVDFDGVNFALHDWSDNNNWASKATERGDAARLSRLARVNPEAARMLRESGAKGISKEEYREYEKYDRTTNVQRRTTNRSTPSPSPAPYAIKDSAPNSGVSNHGQLSLVEVSKPSTASVDGDTNERTNVHDKRRRKTKGADLPPYSPEWEAAWAVYPKHSSKNEAWRAYLDISQADESCPDLPTLAKMIEYRTFEPDWNVKKDPSREKYIPHMATWLRRRGWEDDGCKLPEKKPDDIWWEEFNRQGCATNFGMPRNQKEAIELYGKSVQNPVL